MTNKQYNHLRTTLNQVLFLALLAFSGPHLRPWALVFVLLGESVRTWAAGLLRKNEVLTTAGPYRFSRNPLYVGSILSGLGAALAVGNDWLLLATCVVFVPLYHGMIKREEADLLALYGDRYREYLQSVPRYLGCRIGPAQPGGFSWGMAVHNREHQTWVALALFIALLFVRATLLPPLPFLK